MEKPVLVQLLSTFRIGGAEAFVLELARALGSGPYHPVAVALRETGPMQARFEEAGIETAVIGCARSRLDLGGFLRLCRWLKERRVSVLHCHNRLAHIHGALAARRAGIPVVVCTRHAAPTAWRAGKPKWIERLVIPMTAHFVAVSEAVQMTGLRLGRLPRERTTVIHNGINLSRFTPATARTPQPPVIVCVARLSPEKGHAVLLDAARILQDNGVAFRLRLVGDGPHRKAIEEQIAGLNLQEVVEMLGARGDVADLLRAADVFVLASDSEGLPMTLIEAMACGLPVAATRVGGVPELVSEEETGLMVSPQDPCALAAALARLLEEPVERRRMGEAARRVAEERFDIALCARRHEALYDRLLGARRPEAAP